MEDVMNLWGLLEQHEVKDLVKMRRHLHRNPELSFEEHGTSAYIQEQLKLFGVEDVKTCAQTGVVAIIEGASAGPTLAFRGDIDALPIQETGDVEYASLNPGVMHACGHDVHTTIGLGIARHLASRKQDLHGRIKCIFQPAEEASPKHEPIGAERMVCEGVLKNPDVDAIFAFHCMPTLEAGKIGYTGGPVWANSDLVEIFIEGEKTHGAYPHTGVDALLVAAQVMVAMQSIVSRRVDARHACVLSVGKIESGESYNIVADSAHLTGILRTLSDEATEVTKRELVRLVEGVCRGLGARGVVKFTSGARLVENASWLEERTVGVLKKLAGEDRIVPHEPQMGAEDFASFSQRVPACYLFLGVRNEERGITHMLHTSRFDVDESCLSLGVGVMGEAMLELGRTWSL